MVKKDSNAKWLVLSLVIIGVIFFLIMMIASIFAGFNISGNTAHIKIRGVITSGGESFLGSVTTSSEDIVDDLRKAEENDKIQAILIDINSPGGSAVASEEIATAIKSSKKPVVALIRDIGTSGAYWAASSADVVVASPLSITGSIGATASYLEFTELMKKYGLGYERLVSGEFKDSGAPFRELNEEERDFLQEMIEFTGDYFAQQVQENRGLSSEVVGEISSGRIYIGQQALNLNLVDELGNIERSKELIRELAELDSVSLVEYKRKKAFSITSLLSQQAAIIGKSIGASLLPKENPISLT